MMTASTFDDLVGKTIWQIERTLDWHGETRMLVLHLDDLTAFYMYDEEHGTGNDVSIRLTDISGDLDDLLNEPLLVAEMAKQDDNSSTPDDGQNWTFYRFATQKGFVVLRWLGQSNGYYSEEVSTKMVDDRANASNPDYLSCVANQEKTLILENIPDHATKNKPSAPSKKM